MATTDRIADLEQQVRELQQLVQTAIPSSSRYQAGQDVRFAKIIRGPEDTEYTPSNRPWIIFLGRGDWSLGPTSEVEYEDRTTGPKVRAVMLNGLSPEQELTRVAVVWHRGQWVVSNDPTIQTRYQGVAKTNWKKQGTDWPSAYWADNVPPTLSQIGYVEVDVTTIVDGDPVVTTYTVYLPTGPGRDPNVIEGQIITFELVPGVEDPQAEGEPYYEATCEYDDAFIGATTFIFGYSGPLIQPGWVICDGTQDDTKTLSGDAFDMTDRVPMGAGNFDSSNPGDPEISITNIHEFIGDHTFITGTVDIGGGGGSTDVLIPSIASPPDFEIREHVAHPTPPETMEGEALPKRRYVWFLERIDNSA